MGLGASVGGGEGAVCGDSGLAPMVTLRRPRNDPSGVTETRWTGTLLRPWNSPSGTKETWRAL